MTYFVISIDKSFRWVSEKYFDSVFARLFFILSIGVIVAEYTTFETNVFFVSIVVGMLFMIFSTFRVNILGKWIFIFSWSLFLFGSGGWLLRQRVMPDIDELSRVNHSYIVELKSVPKNKGAYYSVEAEIVYANDIFQDAINTYKKNIGKHIENKNIMEVKSKELPQDVDVVIGGFPCQGFSIANKNRNTNTTIK